MVKAVLKKTTFFYKPLVRLTLSLNSVDIADGGAAHFAKTVSVLKERYNLQSLFVRGVYE